MPLITDFTNGPEELNQWKSQEADISIRSDASYSGSTSLEIGTYLFPDFPIAYSKSYTVSAPVSDITAYVKKNGDGGGIVFYFAIQGLTNGFSGYAVEVNNYYEDSNMRVLKYTNGSSTELKSIDLSGSVFTANWDTISITNWGTSGSIEAEFNGETNNTITATDSTYSSGFIGMSVSDYNDRIDNITASNFTKRTPGGPANLQTQ